MGTATDHATSFTHHLGLETERAENGESVVRLALAPHHRHDHGDVHGGVLSAMLEAAMAQAALSRVDPARGVATVDLHVNFLATATGDRLTGLGRTSGGGRSLCFCEARVEDAAGRTVAQAMGTLRYRDPA